jgi:hypothetical protein
MSHALSEFARRVETLIHHGAAETPCPGNCPESEAVSRFETLALELFALQYESNAPYRRFCDQRHATPRSVADWTAIPALPVAGFKELELTSLAPDARATVFQSSGTTGHRPSRHFHCAESLSLYEASVRPWFRRHLLAGLAPGSGTLLALTPPPEQAPHSSLVHMLSALAASEGWRDAAFTGRVDTDGGWTLETAGTLDRLRSAAGAGQPLVLAGTAFNFVHLLDALAARGLRLALPAGSRVMETGGYKGRSRALSRVELHGAIADRLGVPAAFIVGEYGMCELGSQAYDTLAGAAESPADGPRRFQFPPWARARVVCPETGRAVGEGETGLLRVFDLANVWSVMAVQTEDLGRRRGAGFELLGRAAPAEPRGCSLMSA